MRWWRSRTRWVGQFLRKSRNNICEFKLQIWCLTQVLCFNSMNIHLQVEFLWTRAHSRHSSSHWRRSRPASRGLAPCTLYCSEGLSESLLSLLVPLLPKKIKIKIPWPVNTDLCYAFPCFRSQQPSAVNKSSKAKPYLPQVTLCRSVDDLVYHAVVLVLQRRWHPSDVQLALLTCVAHCHICRRVQKNCPTNKIASWRLRLFVLVLTCINQHLRRL